MQAIPREGHNNERICRVIQAGCISYEQGWQWQRQLATERSAGKVEDTVLLLQHPPTITLGRAACQAHVLFSPEVLAERGVTLVQTDRGGDVTYHAPGQLVGYPILKIGRYGGSVLQYVRNLEEVIIRVLATYELVGERVEGLTGVWIGQAKIAAIGVKVSASGVSTHGFALNVAPDMQGFSQIIPCGIRDRQVTSLQQQLAGSAPPMEEVIERVIASFCAVFAVRAVVSSPIEPSERLRAGPWTVDCGP
jgi:lipoyl(octanoyl) transferase